MIAANQAITQSSLTEVQVHLSNFIQQQKNAFYNDLEA